MLTGPPPKFHGTRDILVFDHRDNNRGSPPSAHHSDVSNLSPGDTVNIAGPQSIYDLV